MSGDVQAWQKGVDQLKGQNNPQAQSQLLMQMGRFYEEKEPDRAMAVLQ